MSLGRVASGSLRDDSRIQRATSTAIWPIEANNSAMGQNWHVVVEARRSVQKTEIARFELAEPNERGRTAGMARRLGDRGRCAVALDAALEATIRRQKT